MTIKSTRLLHLQSGLLFLLALITQGVFSQEPENAVQAELAHYKKVFSSGTQKEQILASKEIKWKGITDTELFDIVEQNFLGSYQNTNRKAMEYSSWMAQVMAFSGQKKYWETLVDAKVKASSAENTKLLRHIKGALLHLPKFEKWNPVISQNLEEITAEEGKEALARQRTKNMVGAEDPELVRAGASMVYSHYTLDAEMHKVVAEQLKKFYPSAQQGEEIAEATAWLCKVLGASENAEYIPLLEEVKNASTQKAVVRWSRKSLTRLKKST